MSPTTPDLPSDPDALRALAVNLRARLSLAEAELAAKALLVEKLQAQLAALRRARFGASSEVLDRQIEQLELALGELEESAAHDEAREAGPPLATPGEANAAQAAKRKTRGPRRPLPDTLPREIVRHEPPACCPECGGTKLSVIGEDRRDVLEFVPAHFKVIVHVRPKVSCRACETITQPPTPSVPIERALPGPGLLAHVAVSKFCDHLPLYRQSEIYARLGLELDRKTLAEWMGKLAFLLEPLAEAIGVYVRAGAALHADDTPVPVLDPGRGRTKTGRLWTLVRDERPWSGAGPPAAFYAYSPDRKGEHARSLLAGCQGFLHADAYAGFEALYAPDPRSGKPRLAEVACWAHVRRKIFEVHEATGSPAAREALERMAELFAIEARISGRAPAHRLAERQARSVPKLAELKAFLDATLRTVSGKGTLAGAIRYATARWPALTRFAWR
jgi:transposase